MGRQITVNPLTRIEGHARIAVDLDDAGNVARAHLQVQEMRGFEKLVENMELFKMPLITARICGVCPVAHHLAAVAAIESGLGVTPPKEALLLRELLYMGHILHSHALSTFVLVGPDLMLGMGADPATRNVFHLLRIQPEFARAALRLRSIGQRAVEVIGGRGTHPITAVPGGMASRPTAEELAGIGRAAKEAVDLACELAHAISARLAAIADQRGGALPCSSLALSRDGQASYLSGEWTLVDQAGAVEDRFAAADYAAKIVEHTVPGSYMKEMRLRAGGKEFMVGSLARLHVNKTLSTPEANTLLQAYRAKGPRLAAIDYVEARLIEMVHCAERMAAIVGGELSGGPILTECAPKAGHFVGAVEAPRGLLVHDYTANDQGRITEANLLVATQANCAAIDHAIADQARYWLPKNDEASLVNGLEFAVRCFDPCLSCATHAAGRMPLEVAIRQSGSVRTIRRESK
jgi:F420-non-reducing hydrogenase large subunit